jgi:hypothetical protein
VSKSVGRWINDFLVTLVAIEHRVDPLFRDAFDAAFQAPLTALVQGLLRSVRANPETFLGEERFIPGEESIADAIVAEMEAFTRRTYADRLAERAGNTKTYGVVDATFEVLPDLPERLRQGVFAEPRTFEACIRFAGPGPRWPPDVRDAGILSIGIKLLDVPGEKLCGDESSTQDFLGISAPTFTTPNIVENLKLQRAVNAGTPLFYFLNPFDSHFLDLLMQGLYARMNSSPVEVRYWSCVPYLLGERQAMKYSIRPVAQTKTRIPWKIPVDWLRDALAATLSARPVALEFAIQLQTDARRMPIEDASIRWSERLSPFVPVARITIPQQTFDTPERARLARELAFNPWHGLPAHRPLGNQNRARYRIYTALSRLRQAMNGEPHIVPAAREK